MIASFQNSKGLNWLLIIAIIGDFAVPYLLAHFYDGYSHKRMVMSSLANPSSPVRTFYQIWLILLGFFLIASSGVVTTKYWLISKSLTAAALVLILAFAIGAGILAGIFSVNETKKVVTLSSKIHGIGSALGFMALLSMYFPLGYIAVQNLLN